MFKSQGRYERLNIMDIAPLILYSFDLEIPSYIKGKLPSDTIHLEYIKSNPPRIYVSKKDIIRKRVFSFRRKIKNA